jgi:hypothetical protein
MFLRLKRRVSFDRRSRDAGPGYVWKQTGTRFRAARRTDAVSFYVVETERVNGQPRQRILASLRGYRVTDGGEPVYGCAYRGQDNFFSEAVSEICAIPDAPVAWLVAQLGDHFQCSIPTWVGLPRNQWPGAPPEQLDLIAPTDEERSRAFAATIGVLHTAITATKG